MELQDEILDFIPLTTDFLFKSLWVKGSTDTKKFFYRVIKRIVGYDVSDFDLRYNELPIDTKESVFNKVDIILVAKDRKRIVNIELNKTYYKVLMNRNESYLYKIAGNFYAGRKKDKYEKDLLVDQVNLNCFKAKDNEGISVSEFSMKDKNNNIDLKSIRLFNIYIPIISISCYNKEEQLDYKMFEAKSFKEMAMYAKGNKERMSVLKDMIHVMTAEEDLMTPEERRDFSKALEKEIRKNARREGLKEGRVEGRKLGIKEGRIEGQANIVKQLLNSGMSKEELSQRLNMSLNELNF